LSLLELAGASLLARDKGFAWGLGSAEKFPFFLFILDKGGQDESRHLFAGDVNFFKRRQLSVVCGAGRGEAKGA